MQYFDTKVFHRSEFFAPLFQFVACKLHLFSSEFGVQFEKEMEKEGQGRPRLASTIKETQEET